jgi:hypothetical protein
MDTHNAGSKDAAEGTGDVGNGDITGDMVTVDLVTLTLLTPIAHPQRQGPDRFHT